MTDNKKKKRQYKNKTPGQERDFEILSARRMFKAYEDVPANHTGPAIANWDPPLGKPTKIMYKKKKRELDMETLQTDNRIDGRTKSYRDAVRRIRERQEKMKERQTNDNVNQFALQAANPFGKKVDEAIPMHTPKDRAATDAVVDAWKKAGGEVKKLKPGHPKGMDPRRKKLKKQLNQEEVEMNKKYLETKPDSLEAAAYQSANTEVPVNPNSLRPTLHLPKNKYLETKEGSLERAVEEAMIEKHVPGHVDKPKLPRQLKDPKKEKMVGIKGKGTVVVDRKDPKYKGAPEHESVENEGWGAVAKFADSQAAGEKKKKETATNKKVSSWAKKEDMSLAPKGKGRKAAKALYKEGEWADSKAQERKDTAAMLKKQNEREKRYQAQQAKQKQAKEGVSDLVNRIQFGKPFEVVDEDDDRRTDDAIDAYDKSKDASRDADWDTVHGKIKQGKKEKKYAKKERGEIDKDDPNWKSRAYHTGMHGEEIKPLSQEFVDAILNSKWIGEDKLSYKERQGLSKSQFALPGKGSGPEGKQGGSYPIPDESHARNALARVSQHGTSAEKSKVQSAVEKKFPNIKVSESKEAEKGERDVGSDAYANYVKGLTPGQEANPRITNKQAAETAARVVGQTETGKRKKDRIDDEYVPTLEEYVTHLESLEGDELETELENLSQNELLEILGTGLVKKAGKSLMKRFSAGGRLAAAKKKGAKIKVKSDIMTQKTSNIAAKSKLKAQKAGFKDAKKKAKMPPAPAAAPAKPAAKPKLKVVGGDTPKPAGEAPKKPAKVKMVPGKGIVAAEFEPGSLIARTMDELSKKVLGRYVKQAAHDTAGAGIDLVVGDEEEYC